MSRCPLILTVLLASVGVAPAAGAEPERVSPFVLPWDDASGGVTDVSGWLHRPAGKLGHVHAGPDGHLYAGSERVRFFGVNVCFGAAFPRPEDADKVAARMAKFGINVVRFHHMDMSAFPGGIRARNTPDTRDLDPEALDRLDQFVARLKAHGVYTNLNLLVSRPFNRADGLPAEIEQVDWKDRHVAGFFYEPIRKLQQEYARKLLTHRNRVTGLTYAEDPAVAFVEINNEDGLIHGWLGNQLDRLPEVFQKDLRRQWNAWLKERYATTDKLRQAWGAKNAAPGAELLANHDFRRGTDRWVLERHDQAAATAMPSEDLPPALRKASSPVHSVKIAVTQPGPMAWHVQFNQAGLKVRASQPYTLTFWAKAERPTEMTALVGQAHEPWQGVGLTTPVHLTPEWKSFRFVFEPTATDDNVRVSFSDLARQTATVWLAGISFRPGGGVGLGAGERVEDGSVPTFPHARFGERSAEAQRDWLRFLWQTEDAYWQAMERYLKEELKVRAVVIGTIVGCSTPNLMAKFDAVDTHAYWQHPHFPGRQWDMNNWTVANRTMVNEAGGTLPGLALRRVLGKPHCVTEYNHSAPNTYGSEGFLLLAAYGALQDWDALYAFAYSHRGDWDTRHITSFFDIDQHPTKMATLPAVAALFLRGDVRPAREQLVAVLDREREVDTLRKAHAWELVHAGTVGLPREAALMHRVAVRTGEGKGTASSNDFSPVPGPRYTSDTGELSWDLSDKTHGLVMVNTPKSKAVIGYGGGKRLDLGGVVIEAGPSEQEGWSAITVSAMEGDLSGGVARLLVTATGYADNAGLVWKNAEHNSVGSNWGRAPSRVEGVTVRITLPCPAGRVRAWALDERGQRKTPVSVESGDGGKAVVALGPAAQTLWYEVEIQKN